MPRRLRALFFPSPTSRWIALVCSLSSSYKSLVFFVRQWWHFWPSEEPFFSNREVLSHRPWSFTKLRSANRCCSNFTGNWNSVYPILLVRAILHLPSFWLTWEKRPRSRVCQKCITCYAWCKLRRHIAHTPLGNMVYASAEESKEEKAPFTSWM